MIKCVDCGKEIPEDHDLYCDTCGAPICEECGTTGLCSTCAELWESEIDLEDTEEKELRCCPMNEREVFASSRLINSKNQRFELVEEVR